MSAVRLFHSFFFFLLSSNLPISLYIYLSPFNLFLSFSWFLSFKLSFPSPPPTFSPISLNLFPFLSFFLRHISFNLLTSLSIVQTLFVCVSLPASPSSLFFNLFLLSLSAPLSLSVYPLVHWYQSAYQPDFHLSFSYQSISDCFSLFCCSFVSAINFRQKQKSFSP